MNLVHNSMLTRLISILLFLVPAPGNAGDPRLARLFAADGVEGTLVIQSLKTGHTIVHNDVRAGQQYSPASTFKVMNTLIAVEEGAVASADDTFKWNGHVYALPDWRHDQTLLSAFQASCVRCYQELARRIGADRYRCHLRQSRYGTLSGEPDTTMFWLDGSLQISAREQVAFLEKVVRRQLPFRTEAYETLQRVVLVNKTPAYALWAKTGWATGEQPNVGWYVGYVETTEDVWLFALNMDVTDADRLPLRQALLMRALRAERIVD